MPHPLPDDIQSVTGLKWFIVAIPDDPAYTRAGMDVYTEMANFWKWGKEGPVPGDSDLAAQHWADAIYATMEFIQVGFATELLGYIDEVEGKLQAIADAVEAVQAITQINACCDQIPGPPQPDPGIEIEVGDPPADYGDTTLTEGWDEYKRLVCGAALAWVDGMEDLHEAFADAVQNGLVVLGGLAAILAIASGLGLIAAVVAVGFTGALGLFAAITQGLTSATISASANYLRNNKQVIANVIFCAGSAEQAEIDVKAYLEANMDAANWAVTQWFDYRKGMRAIYSGLDDAGNALAVPESTNCSCGGLQPTVCSGVETSPGAYGSVFTAGCHRIELSWNLPVLITVTDFNGSVVQCGGVALYRVGESATTFDCNPADVTIVHSGTTVNNEPGDYLTVVNNSAFNIVVEAVAQ